MAKLNVIAIDGPAGSGKSTVAKVVAKKLGFLYIDTGAMYRALTLKAMRDGADFTDEKKLINISKETKILLDDSVYPIKVFLDGKEVTYDIRTLEVSSNVKYLASLREVRENMVKLQRELGKSSPGAALEGRDIGTVVFSDAAYKFYLDASFDVRAERRFKELKEKGIDISPEEVRRDVAERDHSDMTREIGPLRKATDAIVVDTTELGVEEVVDKILAVVTKKP